MKTISVQQGTQAWLDLRAKHFTASEAPAMMGASKYKSRDQLLHEKATGDVAEVTPEKQTLFDRGHAAEAAARPIAEGIVGDDLLPATVVDDDGWLLASLDGMALIEDALFEHKLFNEKLAQAVKHGELPPEYYWQLEHQMLVTGVERVLFMVSDGTEDNCAWMWYEPVAGRAEQLIAGWTQFQADLDNYQPVERTPEAVGEVVTDLPAVRVEVSGAIDIKSNLDVFGDALREFITHQLISNPQTDQDFADLDLQIKALKKAESALDAAEEHMLAQVTTVDEIKRTKDALRELARSNRLQSEKLFKAEKDRRRAEIWQGGKDALAAHIEAINADLERVRMPQVMADFSGAMKGKKTLDSLKSAVNDELARAKIEANRIADGIRANLKILDKLAPEHGFLFSDLQSIVAKPHDDFETLVKVRLQEHQDAEQKRIEAERERIRREEAERLEREQREREAAELAAVDEQDRLEQQRQAEANKQVQDEVSEADAEDKPQKAPSPMPSEPKCPFNVEAGANRVRIIDRGDGSGYYLTLNQAAQLRNALDAAIRKAVDAA